MRASMPACRAAGARVLDFEPDSSLRYSRTGTRAQLISIAKAGLVAKNGVFKCALVMNVGQEQWVQ
jgi:hypothetical protein